MGYCAQLKVEPRQFLMMADTGLSTVSGEIPHMVANWEHQEGESSS